MSNSYENEINELVDGIMKVAEEATASTGMEKEAGIFNRKKKSELSANKAKANEMFSGQGGDDSASDPKGKVQRKWKRIKAKFFKKANENTEEMIEKIAAAAGTEVDMLLDYIEKIAAEEDLDGQDIVDTLYEDIEDEDIEDEEEYEDEDIEDEDIEDGDIEDGEEYEDEEYEEYGEEVEASMINDAMEKIAAVAGMDEETVADYIVAVAAENEIDELEVLAALEDEADEVLEKEAGPSVFRRAGNLRKKVDSAIGRTMMGEGYDDYNDKRHITRAEKAKLKTSKRSLADYYSAEEAEMGARDKTMKTSMLRAGVPLTAASGALGGALGGKKGALISAAAVPAMMGASYAGQKLYDTGKKAWNRKRLALDARDDAAEAAEKQAFEVLIDEAIEKVAYVAGVDTEDVIDYVEKVAYENDLDEIEVLAELEKEAAPKFINNVKGKIDGARVQAHLGAMEHPKLAKGLKIGGGVAGTAALAGAGYAGYKHLQKRKAQAEAEKQAFEVLIDEAIEKVAYVAGVDTEDVIDYVEKVAYENDLDEIEVLAELEKEAAPKFINNVKGKIDGARVQAHLGAMEHPKLAKGLKIGGGVAGTAALAGAGYAGYKHLQKRKARRAEESEE